jgi:hypothetical protein
VYDNYDEDEYNIINELRQKGKDKLMEKKNLMNDLNDLTIENKSLSVLLDILNENGVRKSIISSLVPPINDELKRLLKDIKYPYDVFLDGEFNALIYDNYLI